MCNMARPFLKWAGGKRQLLHEIESRLPEDFGKCTSYIEPFVGGGAVLCHLLEKRTFDEIHISDINPELVLCYRTLKSDAKSVIEHITKLIEEYPTDLEDRRRYTTEYVVIGIMVLGQFPNWVKKTKLSGLHKLYS